MELQLEPGLAKERLDKVLSRLVPDVTRETIKRWILEGRVTVDGRPLRPKDRVGGGTTIQVEPGTALLSEALAEDSVSFGRLYEDEEVLVVSKPAGLVVHPARGHRSGTLVNGLLALPGFRSPPADPRDPEGHLRPGIVHRIDRDTSGLLVVAKTEFARESLKRQLEQRTVHRRYLALTWGVPKNARLESLHGRDPKSRLRFTTRVSEGKRAVTNVDMLETLAGGRCALVSCRLETGRTHQIRVHLAELCGAPLLADTLYGGMRSSPDILELERALGRQALHAAELGFSHPRTLEQLHFEEPLPDDMSACLEQLRVSVAPGR